MKLLLSIALVWFVISGSGCAMIHAASPMPNVQDEGIQVGMSLEEVERILNATGSQNPAIGWVQFEYMDSHAWEYRAGIYMLLGAWSAWTAEVFLSPVEYAIWRSARRHATAVFIDDRLISFEARTIDRRLVRSAGPPLVIPAMHWRSTFGKTIDAAREGWSDD